MTDKPTVLVFAGSARKEALSKRLAHAAGLVVADHGGVPKVIDLRDFEAPVYDGDYEDEHGVPKTMKQLNALIHAHDGLIVVTPEYNGFFTPLTKNALDWCSRGGATEERPPLPFGKPVAILGSAGGPLGGLRAIPRLRDYLNELGFLVVPGSAAISKAHEAFGEDGRLASEQQAKLVDTAVGTLVRHLASAQ